MAATTEQKVDFLLKKIGYVASKTGIAEDENSLSGTKKAPFAEAIPSPLVTPSTSIWADASLIPATPPGSDTSYVRVYLTGTSGVRMTVDNTVSGNRTFIARSTYGNDSSAILGDWIDTSFGADYIIKVFKGDPNSGGVQLSAAGAGSNDTWFFDYSSGVLNFNGTQIPSGVTSSNIYIVGYRYIGAKGGRPAAGIATFASLDVSGISTFRDDVNFISANGNNILFDKSDNALKFGDNVKAQFGDSQDLSIYHNGTNSYIEDSNGSAHFNILSHRFQILNQAGNESMARFYANGAAELYFNNNLKFETNNTGINVTGLTETDTLTTGNATFTGSVSAGSTTGIDGYYLKSTGIGVTWAVLPSSRTGLTTTATAGQTSFNFSYNVGFVDVFLNGVKLPSSEFTASNGSTIVLDDAAFVNDTLEFISLNTVPVSSAGTLGGLTDVNITSPVAGQALRYNGVKFVNDYHPHSTTTSTSQVSITNLPIASYRSAEYLIQVTEGTKYHVTKIIAIHDGTNVTFNEYGTITTHSSLATFTLDINSGSMRLLATPASTNSTTFKVKFDAITV